MTWDIVRNGSESIGASVIPGVLAERGATIGRTGVVPRAAQMQFVIDALRLATGDGLALTYDGDAVWTGTVRDVRQIQDEELRELRWAVRATGVIADVVAVQRAQTRVYEGVRRDQASGHVLAAALSDSSRYAVEADATQPQIRWWWLDGSPWRSLLQLQGPVPPYENAAGVLQLRASRSTTEWPMRGSGIAGTATRLSRLQNEDAGLDRVVNRAAVPYAVESVADPLEYDISTDNPYIVAEPTLVFAGAAGYLAGSGAFPTVRTPSNALVAERSERLLTGVLTTQTVDVQVQTTDSTMTLLWKSHPADEMEATGGTLMARGSDDAFATGIVLADSSRAVVTRAREASVAVNLPSDAVNVRVAITALTAYSVSLRRASSGGFSHWAALVRGTPRPAFPSFSRTRPTIVRPAGWSAGANVLSQQATYARVSYANGRVTLTPQRFSNAVALDATVRVTYQTSAGARSMGVLTAGVISPSEGGSGAETTATYSGTSSVTRRAQAGQVAIALSGHDPPRRVEVGDAIAPVEVVFAALVVESQLNTAPSVSVASPWMLIESAAPLYVAILEPMAHTTLAAPSWTVTGPANINRLTAMVAVGQALQEIWRTPETLALPATATAQLSAPAVSYQAPVRGLDYRLGEGASVTSIAITPGLGLSLNIAIEGTGEIAGLRIRGLLAEQIGEEPTENAASIAEHGIQESPRRPWGWGRRGEVVPRLTPDPLRSWQVVLDANRDAEAMRTALGVEIDDLMPTHVDAKFNRTGRVVGLRHELVGTAPLLRTTFTVLDTQTGSDTMATAPAAPAAPVVRAHGRRQLLALATPPADGGARIIAYEWRWRLQGTAPWQESVVAAPSLVLGPFTIGQTYEVQVRARNIIGAGDYSPSGLGTVEAGLPIMASGTAIAAVATLSEAEASIGRAGVGEPLTVEVSLSDAAGVRTVIVRRGSGEALAATASLADATGTIAAVVRTGSGEALAATAALSEATGNAIGVPVVASGTAIEATAELSDATGMAAATPVGALTLDDIPIKLADHFIVVADEEESNG